MVTAPRTAAGAQTLARGIAALQAVVAAPGGLAVQELADVLDVHRTIAYRLLSTLVDAGLLAKGDDGRYRGSVGLLDLRVAGYDAVRHVAEPLLGDLADDLGATVSLLVPEQDEAVALVVIGPRAAGYHIAFSVGSRHPLDRGAAGHALSSALPATPGDDPLLAEVRSRGYAITYAEVEPGAWGIAAPLRLPGGRIACVNVISHREDLVRAAVDRVLACARALEERAAALS